jgi:Xaa-Pro aminopeptidase
MMIKRRLFILAGLFIAASWSLLYALPDEERPSERPLDNQALIKEGYAFKSLSKRRTKLLKDLPANSTLLLCSARAPAEDYDPYRQLSDFLYLTGLEFSQGYLILHKDGQNKLSDVLLLPRRNPAKEMWEGQKPSVDSESATKRGHTAIAATGRLSSLVNKYLEASSTLYIGGIKKKQLAEKGIKVPLRVKVKSAAYPVAKLRLVKDAGEIRLLERAIDITCAAQIEAMKSIRQGQFEYEVQACIEYMFKRYGSRLPAFNSICGSGPKSCVLHYSSNTRRMKKGDLIVVDVGAAFAGYCADVTRTFPISGTFSARQKEIYNIVLKAQIAGIQAVKPGATLRDVHRAASNVIRKAGYGRYFRHGTSHWLGLETHDVPYAPRGATLKPGMVLTVEPGIYIAAEEIGVRIEDDVVVTDKGCRVLSDGVPKTVEAIEAIMKNAAGVGARKVTPVIIRRQKKARTKASKDDGKGKKKRRSF